MGSIFTLLVYKNLHPKTHGMQKSKRTKFVVHQRFAIYTDFSTSDTTYGVQPTFKKQLFVH